MTSSTIKGARLTDGERAHVEEVICREVLAKGLTSMRVKDFLRALGWRDDRLPSLRDYLQGSQRAIAKRLSTKFGHPVLPRISVTRTLLSLALPEPDQCTGCGRPLEVIERGGPHYGDCTIEKPRFIAEEMNGRIAEVKARVDDIKTRISDLQNDMPAYRERADRGERGGVEKYREMNRRREAAMGELRLAKTELIALSGRGSDPKWSLIIEAWRVLEALAAAGADIGERGHKLLEDIEFHVPPQKLMADDEAEETDELDGEEPG